MWKLYDDLYIGIPSGIRIDACVIGEKWAAVRAGGNVGVAPVLEPSGLCGDAYAGAYLRDTACHLRWDTLAQASVGVAAMNAWYNTAVRAAALGSSASNYDGLAGKRTAVVGDCPRFAQTPGAAAAAHFPCPRLGALDADTCAALRTFDLVVISTDALVTRALPALLDAVGEAGAVVLEGAALPASALFFAFDMPVRRLLGICLPPDDAVLDAVRAGAAGPLPGAQPFCIVPAPVSRLHESTRAARFAASPYKAAGFNPAACRDWEGRDYDRSSWSKIFKF